MVWRNYLAAVITGQLSKLAAVGVGLWLTPYVLQFLDREAYGVFALAMSVITWMNLADLGTSAGLQAHLAQISPNATAEEQSRYLSSTFFAQLAAAVIILVLGGTAAVGFPYFFYVSEDLRGPTLTLFACLTLAAAVRQATRGYEAVLAAHQRFHWNHAMQMLSVGLRAGCIVLLVSSGWGLISLGIGHLIAVAAVAALSVVLVRRLLPGFVVRPSLISREALRKVGRSGVWFSLGGLAGVLISGLDRAVAAKLISLQAVTVLYLSSRLYDLAEGLLSTVADSARPVIGRLLGQGSRTDALRIYRRVQRSTLLLSVIAALAIWAGNRAFITAWVGAELYGGAALDAALALALLAKMISLPSRAALAAGLVVKPQTLVRLAEGALNLALSICLAGIIGLAGIVLATSIAAAATSAWRLPRLAGRMFQADCPSAPSRWRLGAFVVFLVVSASLGRLIAGAIGGYAGAGLAIGMTLAVGLAFVWFFETGRELRLKLRSLLPA
jgi:O-antigen/teichoic acid export membrane protein